MKVKDIYNTKDTICAISTAPGEGAIGVVRLSGAKALKIADKVFVSRDKKKPSSFRTHTIHYGWIVKDLKDKKGKVRHESKDIIDEVLLTVMHRPKTYTRQDIVEINCHGGILALKRILELVITKGARLAEAGEFTKRALLGGRIDLAQAEAVLDVIRAKTDLGLEAALGQLRGKLSAKIGEIKEVLLEVLVKLEASFDFSQEEITLDKKDINKRIKLAKRKIEKLLKTSETGRIVREGITTVICGKPNVGKSSLMNAFLREDKVIVTPIAGTTRDAIEDIINIEGLPIRIVDTAGIIEPRDLVEKEGITRSKKCLDEADLILFVLDNSRSLSGEDLQIIENIKGKAVIVIINKIDLKIKLRLDGIKDFLKDKKIVKICATKEKGIPALEDSIKKYILGGRVGIKAESVLVTNLRHKKELERALRCINTTLSNLGDKRGDELVAEDLKESLKFIGQIAGEVTADEILNRIFDDFCIGK